MTRQDIFVTLGDDILGERCSTSSQRGKINEAIVDINTNVADEGRCRFVFDKESQNVSIFCDIPKKWEVSIQKK